MRTFLLGTDWCTDCDDCVALYLLCGAVKKGQIKLAGIGINACMEYSAASADGFLARVGVRNIPIGIDLKADKAEGRTPYQKGLAPYAKKYLRNEDAEDAVRLYRRVLAESEEPVDVVEIGFLQVFANTLKSGPDDLSPLNGFELIKKKVRKVWVMAGRWDEEKGKEYNFSNTRTAREGAAYFCSHCPVPVTFLGFETGYKVITGAGLKPGHVLYDVFRDFGCLHGRCSWDPMTALLAIIGDEEKAGYTRIRGHAHVDEVTGENTFVRDDSSDCGYVVPKFGTDYYRDAINRLLY